MNIHEGRVNICYFLIYIVYSFMEGKKNMYKCVLVGEIKGLNKRSIEKGHCCIDMKEL